MDERIRIVKEDFATSRDGLRIVGERYYPEGGEGLPIAIVSHGFMANMTTTRDYARQLAKWGFAAYCFDFNGGCVIGKSEGKSTDMSVITEVADLEAVLAYARAEAFTDGDKVLLMGCSQGGFVSALAAAKPENKVRRLVLFYPALCIPDDARAGCMQGACFDPDNVPEIFQCGPMTLGKRYPLDVMGLDPFTEIAAYKGRVLIVHGDMDEIVNVSYAYRAEQAYSGKCDEDRLTGRVQLRIIEGAGHGFRGNEVIAAMEAVRQFLKGCVEVLCVDVQLTDRIVDIDKLSAHVSLPFTGTTSTAFFSGRIAEGASDEQDYLAGKAQRCCASYKIEGTDFAGEKACVEVENLKIGDGDWKPTLRTDSKALAWLNGADCDAYLDQRKEGPVVHIYAKAPRRERGGAGWKSEIL